MSTNSTIHTRPATIQDKEFVISLLPRLTEFGPPAWRNADRMIAVDTQILSDKLIDQPTGATIFIAEDDKKLHEDSFIYKADC